MTLAICFLGFGEAAQSFCSDARWRGTACGYDIKMLEATYRASKAEEFKRFGVTIKNFDDDTANEHKLFLSVVTADQALIASADVLPHLNEGTLYLDMNSSAPDTKLAASKLLSAKGVDYVDVAIMAPVEPKRLDVPLLISGEKAGQAQQALIALGFQNTRIVGEKIGQASSIKMIRSVMIKGIEALSSECVLAAARAGVAEEVFGSMGEEWLGKANYNLERMMVHGIRRAAEMDEVVKTLEGLGVEPTMSRGTVLRQRRIGQLGIKLVPENLKDKLNILNEALIEVEK